MKSVSATLICLVLLLVAIPAHAQGILFVQKETRSGQSTSNQIQIDREHMRAESVSGNDSMAFVFDGPKQTARMINLTRKTYMEMTKTDLEQMKQQMTSVMAQMEAQLSSLPPAQRQALQEAMRARGGMPGVGAAAAAPKVEYRAAGADRVGEWACRKYEGYVGQQKTMEVCTVDPNQFNLTPADFDVARQLGEFLKNLSPESADRIFINGTVQDQGFAGIPVRRTSFRNGAVESVSEITEFRREAFPVSTFDVPAGFRKEAMIGAPR